MRTVSALFSNKMAARLAVGALVACGIETKEIAIVSQENDDAGGAVAVGAGAGAVVAGTAGLLAGIGLMAIPGLGPIVAAGWITATLTATISGAAVGGAAGALCQSLIRSGFSETDADVFATGVAEGGTFLAVRVSDEQYVKADDILRRAEYVTTYGPSGLLSR